MGLDMYLTKDFYVKNWDHYKPEQRWDITVNRGGDVASEIDPSKISNITVDVAYWRKANAIHKWFVDEVQGGTDECQRSYVTPEQLADLVDRCERILATVTPAFGAVTCDAELAGELLPTQDGFFFGSTDYDEWYIEDLKTTVAQLKPELALEPEEGAWGWDYHYQASW
jgi:hypothetical protein